MHSCLRFAAFVVLAVAGPARVAHSQTKSATTDTSSASSLAASLDTVVPRLLEEMLVPGAAVALIERGRVVRTMGYGMADVQRRIPVTPNTVFNIGSISKTVAAWGLMALVDDKRLDLDAPIERYLTRWHLPPSQFDNSGVTLRRLLSHTAGLSLHGYPGWDPSHPLPTIERSLAGETNGSGDVHVEFAPGTRYEYSGGGYTIAQLVVEELTKQPFSAYMRRRVLQPLGMRSSDYVWSPTIEREAATPYSELGQPVAGVRFIEQAAAGLQSTVADLARFAAASVDGSGETRARVLKDETRRLMQSPQPASPKYGLGYELDTINAQRLAGHTGANSGWKAGFQVLPERGSGIVVLTNGENGQYLNQYLSCIWREAYGALRAGSRCRRAAVPVLLAAWRSGGVRRLAERYAAMRQDSAHYSTGAAHLNIAGYILRQQTPPRLDDAIAVFTLATTTFPNDANAFDSLGEALLMRGDTTRALVNYERAAQLDPENARAREMTDKLRRKP